MLKRRCFGYENDISAEEKTEIQSSWLQKQNEYSRRKKGLTQQKSKGKKSIIRMIKATYNVVFFLRLGR